MAVLSLDGERTLTVLYEPGSFVPLLRIEQERGDPDDEGEAATQAALDQVVRLCAAEGIELPRALQPQASTRVSLYVTDHLGTPLRLVGQERAIEWQARPDDWGAVREQHGIRQPVRFQGQWEDEESGFYYNRYRYYDPRMGRYVTQDPIGLAGGVNTYGYPQNPVSWIDPGGLQSVPTYGGVARDTAVNAASTILPKAAGAVVVPAQAAPALASGIKSLVKADYDHYRALGYHKIREDNKILGACVHKMDWNEYDDFESAWEAMGKTCNGK